MTLAFRSPPSLAFAVLHCPISPMPWIAKKDGADHDRHNEDDHLPNGFPHHLIGGLVSRGGGRNFTTSGQIRNHDAMQISIGAIVEQKPAAIIPANHSGKQPDNRP